jgi:hypothetical protein
MGRLAQTTRDQRSKGGTMHIQRISKVMPAKAITAPPTAADIIGLIEGSLELIVSGRAAIDAIVKKPAA